MFEAGLISPKEILQEQYTDFDILREKPLVFKAGDQHLVCAPIKWHEHPEFILDLSKMLTRYFAIFKNIEFLSTELMKNEGAVKNLISQVMVFQNTREYKRFVKKDMPSFIIRWAITIENEKFVRISKLKARTILEPFHIDELLQVLFTLYCFNYDLVKQNTLDFISRLSVGGNGQARSTSSASTTATERQMPKYSSRPYPKSTLELFARQSAGRLN